jgi:hypothetical protein
MAPVIRVIRPGDTTKPNPFIICIVANPVLEAPWHSGQFITDPITASQSSFDSSAAYAQNREGDDGATEA